MPYVPRPPDTIKCAHCKKPFERRHASRKYCSNSCNVLASYERTGYRGEPRATRADLERTVAQLMALANVKPSLVASKPTTPKPAPKALTKKPAAKAAVKPAAPKPAPKAPTKKPAAKAAVKPVPPTPKPAAKAITTPKPAKKAAKRTVKKKEPAVRVIRL